MNEQTFRDLKAKTVEDLFRIGKCYETGDGVGKNETAAVRWYRLAAEQGLADAMFELSKCYSFGIGVRRNRAVACKWLNKAAERGHVRAMVLLGKRCMFEYEVDYNPRKAVRLFQKAAEKGDPWGMFHLGECYADGVGVTKDYDAAYLWFSRAALAAPDDEMLYQSVQNKIYDPNLKEICDSLKPTPCHSNKEKTK